MAPVSARPAPAPAAAPSPAGTARPASDGYELLIASGVAWIVTAALTGYLALEQLNAGQTLSRFGLDSGSLNASAAWNGFAAVVTAFFGARMLMRATRLLSWSMAWALISVASGAYQVANGVSDATFVLSVVAAGTAGVLSFAAWNTQRQAVS